MRPATRVALTGSRTSYRFDIRMDEKVYAERCQEQTRRKTGTQSFGANAAGQCQPGRQLSMESSVLAFFFVPLPGASSVYGKRVALPLCWPFWLAQIRRMTTTASKARKERDEFSASCLVAPLRCLIIVVVLGLLSGCVSMESGDAPAEESSASDGTGTGTQAILTNTERDAGRLRRVLGDTVFQDDFEDGRLDAWSEVNPRLARVVESASAAEGSRLLELTVPSGSEGTWVTHFFNAEYDSVFVHFKVRFASDWSGNTKLLFVRGSESENVWSAWGTAGQCPDGSRWFQTGNATYGNGSPGILNFYTYFPDMVEDGSSCWGNFGDASTEYVAMPTMARDVWHRVEFWVKLNDPGARDAVQRMWVNGELRADWEGFRLRTSAEVRINSITLHAYPDAPTSHVRRLQYDDLLVMSRAPY